MSSTVPTAACSNGATLRRGRILTLRLVLATVAAAVAMLPLAGALAVTQPHVHELVGITPTTFSLTTSGQREVRLGVAGTVFVPRSRGPFGVLAQVDGRGSRTARALRAATSPHM